MLRMSLECDINNLNYLRYMEYCEKENGSKLGHYESERTTLTEECRQKEE